MAGCSHDLQLLLLQVHAFGQVPMAGDAADLRVVLELALQLLVVILGGSFPGRQLAGGGTHVRNAVTDT